MRPLGGAFAVILGDLGGILGVLGVLGASWSVLGDSGRFLEDLWSHLGIFWEVKRDLESTMQAIILNIEKPLKTL